MGFAVLHGDQPSEVIITKVHKFFISHKQLSVATLHVAEINMSVNILSHKIHTKHHEISKEFATPATPM